MYFCKNCEWISRQILSKWQARRQKEMTEARKTLGNVVGARGWGDLHPGCPFSFLFTCVNFLSLLPVCLLVEEWQGAGRTLDEVSCDSTLFGGDQLQSMEGSPSSLLGCRPDLHQVRTSPSR